MRTYLTTRGLGRDYGFLGSPPAELWWRKFGQLTAFEQPTLLVHADDTGWQVYASAIPTSRRDRTNTPIRLSLALAGEHPPDDHPPDEPPPDEPPPDEPPPDELSGVLALIRSCLDKPSSDPLAALLDVQFPADQTEQLISAAGQGNDGEVHRRIRCVLDALTKDASQPAGPTPAKSGSWLGDADIPEVRAAFADRARALLRGDHRGWAVQLNLAGEAEIRAYFAGQDEPLVALLDERVPGGFRELRPKALTPPAPRGKPTVSRTRIVVAALLLIGLVVLIAWLVFHAPPPHPIPKPSSAPSPSPSSTTQPPSPSPSPLSTSRSP